MAITRLEEVVAEPILAVANGRVERNHPRVFAGKRMKPDIYLIDIDIAIEVDGMHGHGRPTKQREDAERDAAYLEAGVTPMRVRDTSLIRDRDAVIREVARRQRA